MSKIIKTIKFLEDDISLVKRIEKYQKSKGLNSFVSAVRKKISKWGDKLWKSFLL